MATSIGPDVWWQASEEMVLTVVEILEDQAKAAKRKR